MCRVAQICFDYVFLVEDSVARHSIFQRGTCRAGSKFKDAIRPAELDSFRPCYVLCYVIRWEYDNAE